jgi:hypothetical protein
MCHGVSRNYWFQVAIASLTAVSFLLVGFVRAFTESERLDIQRDHSQTSGLRASAARLVSDMNVQESAQESAVRLRSCLLEVA